MVLSYTNVKTNMTLYGSPLCDEAHGTLQQNIPFYARSLSIFMQRAERKHLRKCIYLVIYHPKFLYQNFFKLKVRSSRPLTR